MASTPDPPAVGEPIAEEAGGGYEVGAPIREGWGGTIRDGRYRRTGLRVTVQEIRPDLAASAGLIDRLGQLGREAASVRAPHLLAVYDLVGDGSSFRLVAEWSTGATLAETTRAGTPGPARSLLIVDDVLSGLASLHERGLVHGHVGPDTVVVDLEGRARLAEVAICAAATPPGFGPDTDVRDAARLGLLLLRRAGGRYQAVRRALETATTGTAPSASRLREDLEAAASASLGAGWRDRAGADGGRPASGRRRRRVVAVLVAIVVVAGAVAAGILLIGGRGAGTSTNLPLSVGTDTSLGVSPATSGCNTTFTFIGRGSLTGSGTLVYRWEQSDGQVTAATSLPITSDEGAFQLTQAWRLQGSQKVNGSMTLHLLKPVDRRLSRSFAYICP